MITQVAGPSGLVVGNPAVVNVSWTVTNTAAASTGTSSWIDRVVLSVDAQFGNADDVTLATVVHAGSLAAGGSYSELRSLNLPAGLGGHYYLAVVTDAAGALIEPDGEANNLSAVSPFDVTAPFADLVTEAVSGPAAAESSQSISVTWRVRNSGQAVTSTGNWTDRIYVSTSPTFDASAIQVGQFAHVGLLAPGAAVISQASVTLPDGISGDYYVYVTTDADSAVYEHGERTNNTLRSPGPIIVTRRPDPDLRVTTITAPTAGQPRDAVAVEWTVTNAGPGSAGGSWVDRVYLARGDFSNPVLLSSIVHSAPLSGGGSYSAATSVTLPDVADGDYQLVVITDQAGSVFEGTDEDNNQSAQGFTIVHADLTTAFDSAPATATSGTSIDVAWTTHNSGSGVARAPWTDRILISTDTTPSADDRVLLERPHASPLDPLSEYSETATLALPLDLSGSLYILVVTDAGASVFEFGGEDNNAVSAPWPSRWRRTPTWRSARSRARRCSWAIRSRQRFHGT